jgi:hypothetical protein
MRRDLQRRIERLERGSANETPAAADVTDELRATAVMQVLMQSELHLQLKPTSDDTFLGRIDRVLEAAHGGGLINPRHYAALQFIRKANKDAA